MIVALTTRPYGACRYSDFGIEADLSCRVPADDPHAAGDNAQRGGSGRNDPLNLTSETERLLSRSVAERVIHDLRLDERPEFNPALRKASLVSKAPRDAARPGRQ